MKKALINDWYYINGGAEKVIHSFTNIWDDFDHFALIDFLKDEDRDFILKGKKAKTSFLQKIPNAKENYKNFLQFFPIAIEGFDLTDYDLIISSSASVAKGVLTNHNQIHICYCHSPMRYAWDLYHQYIKDAGLDSGLKGIYTRNILHKIRMWDLLNTNRVDYFIANSNYIRKRIKKIYNRDATVIYPPVDIEHFILEEKKQDYYFTASRIVNYKRVDLIVESFNKLQNCKLIVAGDGPELKRLRKKALSNIEFTSFLNRKELKKYMQNAKAFIFAAEEDFGIAPVEAQACGTPVIAFGRGGALETIIENKTGIFFDKQTPESLIDAVNRFEKMQFNSIEVRENALRFSKERFEQEIKTFVEEKWQEHLDKNNPDSLS